MKVKLFQSQGTNSNGKGNSSDSEVNQIVKKIGFGMFDSENGTEFKKGGGGTGLMYCSSDECKLLIKILMRTSESKSFCSTF